MGQKIAIIEQYLALDSMTTRVSTVINSFNSGVIYSKRRHQFIMHTVVIKCHTSVSLAWTGTPKITQQNLILHIGKSKAKVSFIKDCARGLVLLKLTTDRHESSHGLSPTAELLV